MLERPLPFLASAALATLLLCPANAFTQQITSASNGLIATEDGTTIEVVALRDDILRVRMWKGDSAPEDASWAVLPDARTSGVAVEANAHGFTTKALRVYKKASGNRGGALIE